IGNGNNVVNVFALSAVSDKLMRQLARNTLRFGPMPGEDQSDSALAKGVSCPVKDDKTMPFRVLFESAPGTLPRVDTARVLDRGGKRGVFASHYDRTLRHHGSETIRSVSRRPEGSRSRRSPQFTSLARAREDQTHCRRHEGATLSR